MYKCSNHTTMIGISDNVIASSGTITGNYIKLWNTKVEIIEANPLIGTIY